MGLRVVLELCMVYGWFSCLLVVFAVSAVTVFVLVIWCSLVFGVVTYCV